jgi:hypothetical protein
MADSSAPSFDSSFPQEINTKANSTAAKRDNIFEFIFYPFKLKINKGTKILFS